MSGDARVVVPWSVVPWSVVSGQLSVVSSQWSLHDGFEPSIPIAEGMSELVEWVRTQRAEDRFEEAAGELRAKGLTV